MDHSLEDRDSPVADRMEATRRTVGLSDCPSAVAPATRTPCDQAHRYRYRMQLEDDEGRTDGGVGAHPSRRRRRSERMRMSGSAAGPSRMGLALLICQLLAPPSAAAGGGRALQRQEGECSCSPREFGFRLTLSSSCPPLPPPFPPNSSFGAGVKDYTCSIAPEPVQGRDEGNTIADEIAQIQKEAELAQSTFRTSSANDGGEEDEEESDGGLRLSSWRLNFEEKSNEITGGGVRRRRAQDSAFDYFPELVKVDESEWSSESFQTAAFTTTDTVPSKIISVQFLEVDRDFNVINQDSTYVREQDLVDGDVIRYESVSGRDPAVVPGGLNMVLRGVTPMGERVRNVFTITYTNDCDVYTFEDGEAMGWVEFVDLVEASPQTCTAGSSVTASPTGYAPRPPAPPSKKPSGSAWGGWDPDGYSSPWGDGYWGFSKSAKSKGSKGYVYTSAKSWKTKSSKAKAKSTKSSKMSKGGYWVKSSKAPVAPHDPTAQWGDDGVGSESSAGGGRVSSSKWTHVEPIRDLRDGSSRRLRRQR